MTDFDEISAAIDAQAGGEPAAARKALGKYAVRDQVAVLSTHGGGGSTTVKFVGPITVNFDDTPDFLDQKVIHALAANEALIDVKPVVRVAFSSAFGYVGVGGENYATGDFWTAFQITDLTDDGEFGANSAQFNPIESVTQSPQGAIAFTGPGAVLFQIDPAWVSGQVDLYLLTATLTAP